MKKTVIASVLCFSLAAACLQGCGSLMEGISLPWVSSKSSQETPAPTPEAVETLAPTPEITETPAPTPEVTETPVPTPEVTETPAPTPEPVDESAMYAAYLADLQSRQDVILGYTWQMSDGTSHYPPGSDPNALKPAALVDIWGGEQPELICLYASNPGGTADLRIVGWENGALKELCVFPNWDANAASGTRYALFRVRGEKTLYAYSYIGDELGYYSWYRFREQDGILAAEKAASAEVAWADYSEYENYQDTYTVEGQPADQAAYEAFENALIEKAETTVIFSGMPESDTFLGTLFRKPLAALSYEEMRSRLYAQSGSLPETADDPQTALFTALNGLHLSYASGVGAWSSELSMQADGQFVLNYHDSDMGDSGAGYDATVYISNASGRFDQVQKINDTTYTMRLADISIEDVPGSEWIEDTGSGRVRYVACDAAGLDGIDTVTVYLPGTPMSSIPEDALFRMFYEGTVLNGVVIIGSGDFYTNQLPGTVPAASAAASPSPTAAPSPAVTQGPALTADPASGAAVPSGGEIFPDSSSRQLTDSDLAALSPDQIQTAVNEIYARHGYAFQTPEVRAYFEGFDWYSPDNPDMSAVASQFSDVEQANIALLSSYM